MIIGRGFHVKINANIGNSAVTQRDRGGGREAPLGDALGRRHGDGSLDRRRHPPDPAVDPPQRPGADRHGADLPGAGEGRRHRRGPHLGGLPRHPDRAGGAGGRLLHGPRRGAAPLCAAHGEAAHRDRVARRQHRRQVVPGPPPGVVPLHALPRDLRDHGGLRRVVLAGRRAQARQHRRRQRRGAVRRAQDPGRTDPDRLGARRAGDERGAGSRADAPDQGEHGEAARVVRRGAVLHPRAAHHRRGARLRSHHQRHRRGDDRLDGDRDALLCDPQGTSRAAQSRRREDRGDHLQDRRPRRRPGQGAPAGPGARRRPQQGPVRVPLAGPVPSGARSPDRAGLPRRDPAGRGGQDRPFLQHVRPQVLLDADLAGHPRPGCRAGARAGAGGEGRRVPGQRGELYL